MLQYITLICLIVMPNSVFSGEDWLGIYDDDSEIQELTSRVVKGSSLQRTYIATPISDREMSQVQSLLRTLDINKLPTQPVLFGNKGAFKSFCGKRQ